MEDIYHSILRIVFGIITLIGLVWGAMQYLVKYKVHKSETALKKYSDRNTDKVEEHVKNVENDVYYVGIRMTHAEQAIEDIKTNLKSKAANDKAGTE